jgi:hypothetical protein
MKKIILIIVFLSTFYIKAEEVVAEKFEPRTIRSIGAYFERIMLNDPGYNNFIGISWSEYAIEPASKYFVPFYNLNFGYSNFEDKHWYQMTIAPGFKIRLDDKRRRTGFFKDITIMDLEFTTGLTTLSTNKSEDEHYVGLTSSFSIIFGYKNVQTRITSSVFTNLPYTSSQSFMLSYLF